MGLLVELGLERDGKEESTDGEGDRIPITMEGPSRLLFRFALPKTDDDEDGRKLFRKEGEAVGERSAFLLKLISKALFEGRTAGDRWGDGARLYSEAPLSSSCKVGALGETLGCPV